MRSADVAARVPWQITARDGKKNIEKNVEQKHERPWKTSEQAQKDQKDDFC